MLGLPRACHPGYLGVRSKRLTLGSVGGAWTRRRSSLLFQEAICGELLVITAVVTIVRIVIIVIMEMIMTMVIIWAVEWSRAMSHLPSSPVHGLAPLSFPPVRTACTTSPTEGLHPKPSKILNGSWSACATRILTHLHEVHRSFRNECRTITYFSKQSSQDAVAPSRFKSMKQSFSNSSFHFPFHYPKISPI